MQIKHQGLQQHLEQDLFPIYILAGPEQYFVAQEAKYIKNKYTAQLEIEHKIVTIENAESWKELEQEIYSYSLFSSKTLIDIRCDKKSIDQAGKKVLTHYLENINPQTLIMIRCPNIPAKNLKWISNAAKVMLVNAYSLNPNELMQWINQQLRKQGFSFDKDIVKLIAASTQGNMLACAQVIQKITMTTDHKQKLSVDDIVDHLSDQCEFQLFDLADACLLGNAQKAMHIFTKIQENTDETTLVLWLLTQEIRSLLELQYLLQKNTPFSKACNELKIWTHKTRLYQTATQRLNINILENLLSIAQQLDMGFKSGSPKLIIKHGLERLLITLCLGRQI